MGVTAGPNRTSLLTRLRPRTPQIASPAREPRGVAGEHRAPRAPATGRWAPRRRGLGAKAPQGARPGPSRAEPSREGGPHGPAASATGENGGSPGRAGLGVTHRAGPGGSLSASASSPSPSSAAAASGCSLGPRGAARALGPSVVFRLFLLPAPGSRGGGGGCAGGRWPWGSRGGRCTAALTRLGCGCGCCCGTRRRLRLRRLLENQSLSGLAAPRSRPEPGFDVRTAQPRRARRRAVPQRPLRPRARPSGRADSRQRSPRLGRSGRGRREKAAARALGKGTCWRGLHGRASLPYSLHPGSPYRMMQDLVQGLLTNMIQNTSTPPLSRSVDDTPRIGTGKLKGCFQ
ncbi:translation initiation factor IF-2 [Mustela lutreola]|uniref:translation initiation factor IF-2 n=1 Tax=Mustela lutreola TaxID=9666 RepID=UPI002797B4F9|nr:translation initiation factor IF-2 [Mustela lutreola]